MTDAHRHRQAAESFGVDPERYDRTRPPYPTAMVERILAASPGRRVLDVGCGTGIAARQFRAAGADVLGVEPDPRMAAFAARDGQPVEVAKFEEWDPAGREFDVVVAGTAWHWVDPVVGAARAARVLPPGGRLAPFHHVFQLPEPVVEAHIAALRRVAPDSPFGPEALRDPLGSYQRLFTSIADGMRTAGMFAEPEQWRFDWQRHYDRDEWLDQMPTAGNLTSLPPDALATVLDATAAAIDALGGGFTMDYATVAVTAERISPR